MNLLQLILGNEFFKKKFVSFKTTEILSFITVFVSTDNGRIVTVEMGKTTDLKQNIDG